MRIALVLLAVAAVIAALIGVLILVAEDSGLPDELEPTPAPAAGTAPVSPEPEPEPEPEPSAPPAAVAPSGPVVPEPTGPEADPAAARVVSAFRAIPIAGARVQVVAAGLDPVETRTDRLGQIPAAAALQPGLTLRVTADSFHPLEVELEGEMAGRVFVLEPAGVIRGEVVDQDGAPQPWAALKVGVVIEDATGATIGVPWTAADRMTCDQQGCFLLEGLDPRGRYLIAASLARLGATAKSDIVPAAAATSRPVTLKLGGDNELRVLVTDRAGAPIAVSRAVLSGRPEGLPDAVVVGEAGRALVDLMRRLRFRYRRAMTGSMVRVPGWKNGYGYVYDRMPPGHYTLEIESRGFKPYSTEIEIRRGGPSQHEARLESEEVALTGLVMDAVGGPVPAANLSIHTDGDAFRGYRSASSGPDGSFTIRGPTKWLEPLVLQVAKAGFDATLVRVAPGTRRVTVRLYQSGRVMGEAGFEDKQTGEVLFEFVRSKPQAALERRTHLVRQNWKRFQFTLPRGDYTVRATAPGYRDHRATLTVPSGGDAVMNGFTLRKK